MEPIIRLAADIKSLLKHQPNDAAFKAVLKLSDIIKSMCHRSRLTSGIKVVRASDPPSVLFAGRTGCVAEVIAMFNRIGTFASTKALFARHFYDIVSKNYFPGSSVTGNAFEKSKATTLMVVYQLLSVSLVSHPENQSKLRDPARLGGHRIGLALAKLHDYLSVEALLELFANLLPSARAAGGKEKRMQFIEQVFKQENFSNSHDIIRVLEAPVPDWDITSQKISDLVASKKPYFPQAFETKEIHVGNSESYSVERFYVDGPGFLASIDEGDSLGTIQIPYCQIETFSISNLSNSKTEVTVISKSPPIKNQQVMSLSSQEMGLFRCVWEIKAEDAPKLMNILKQRKLGFLVASQRKISLAGSGIEFSGIHLSHQNQTNAIASLWSDINPGDRTSPILIPSTSYKKGLVSTPRHDDEPHKSEKSTAAEPEANGDEFPAGPVDLGLNPEDSPSQVVRKVTRKNKNALLVRSDSDSNVSIVPESEKASEKNEKVATGVKLARQTRATARAVADSSTTFQSARVTALGKRKLSDELENQSKSKINSPPVKRPRVKRDLGERAFVSNVETLKATKDRPARARRVRESFSPPSSPEQAKIEHGALAINEKATLSRMRNKVGHPRQTKLRQTKLPVTKVHGKRVKAHEIVRIQSEKEDTDAAQNVVKPQARTENASEFPRKRLEGVDAVRPERKETPKHKKAPWNEPAFIARIELSRNETETSPMQLSEPQDNAPQDFDLQVWETTPPAMGKGSAPATQEDTQKKVLTMEDKVSEHRTEPLSYMHTPSVNGQATPRLNTLPAKTSVEIGIQVDSRSITPKAIFAAKRSSSKFEVASAAAKLKSRVQPLERSISIIALTPQSRSEPNKSLLRIARSPTVLRIQRRPATPSPKASHSNKWFKPETVNSRIADVLNEINNVILCQIETKFEAVRSDWIVAHRRMLVGTQEKLRRMHQMNVDHYNKLVELYERYTVGHQAALRLFDGMKSLNQETLDGIRDVVLKHNRHSLCKKFPKSMFAGIPSVIQTRRYLSMTVS
ncbi:hypothetical protein AGABI1DRAFT_125434 [Agaricus bisporus var. burnettii JB137-S8]|uniref:Uncharacterized protein n=1 Tax=Agaricus bisporus var. burnettii (strain JB137-S8 / ATCC MYA-4627 / FGSC 10392) TaxID=597362 RepID=K5XI08_AGABU|nr:uncharacterized protein AGABI1DRAFT_125434 [Agaricus bisporus var. burnettii JB137-S8]EKM82957.1 hypothetical protein AGABI1DRAFT_125434 [Agaricus bisporus var. burnettii JB137-S8]